MNALAAKSKRRRLPGEVAFDRCFIPVAIIFVARMILAGVAVLYFGASKAPTKAELAVQSLPIMGLTWLLPLAGLVLALLWLRAVWTLVRVWNEPSARVLRFPAMVLLIPFGLVARHLLLSPFS